MRAMALVCCCVLLTACASQSAAVPSDEAGVVDIVWPSPPARARIAYEFAFAGPADLGIRRSAARKLMDAFAGEKFVGMTRPYAVSVLGRAILVADPGGHAVHLFDRDRRKHLTVAEVEGEALMSPVGVALDTERMYVADSGRDKVFLLDRSGEHIGTIDGLERPTALAFDPAARRLYVAETLGHRILVFDADGRRLFQFGERGEQDDQLNFPTHLAVAGGKVLVNDSMNFRIKAFSLEGRPLAAFGEHGDSSGQIAQPKGIAADSAGNVYVAGAVIDRVQIFSPAGEFLLAFGQEGNGPGQFRMPAGVTIADDLIYVADSYNGRVQVFRFLGGD